MWGIILFLIFSVMQKSAHTSHSRRRTLQERISRQTKASLAVILNKRQLRLWRCQRARLCASHVWFCEVVFRGTCYCWSHFTIGNFGKASQTYHHKPLDTILNTATAALGFAGRFFHLWGHDIYITVSDKIYVGTCFATKMLERVITRKAKTKCEDSKDFFARLRGLRSY